MTLKLNPILSFEDTLHTDTLNLIKTLCQTLTYQKIKNEFNNEDINIHLPILYYHLILNKPYYHQTQNIQKIYHLSKYEAFIIDRIIYQQRPIYQLFDLCVNKDDLINTKGIYQMNSGRYIKLKEGD